MCYGTFLYLTVLADTRFALGYSVRVYGTFQNEFPEEHYV